MNLAETAAKIAASAVEFLATKHGVHTDDVLHNLGTDRRLTEQFERLVRAGIDKAAEMVAAGEIEVTA